MSCTTDPREIPQSRSRYTPNRFLAVFLLLVSFLLTVWLIPCYVSGYTTGTHGLSPRFFPYLITLVLTGLSLLLLAKDLARPEDSVSRKEDKRITKATGLTMFILIGYYILIRIIGMIPASVAANIFLVRLFGFQRWKDNPDLQCVFNPDLIPIFRKNRPSAHAQGTVVRWFVLTLTGVGNGRYMGSCSRLCGYLYK